MNHNEFVRSSMSQALLEEMASLFMAVKRKAPGRVSVDVDTFTLKVRAPLDWLDGPEIEVRVHRRGKGKPALLVHGWQSQAAEMHELSGALVDAGFEVWMPDLPGHGYSSGTHLSLPLAVSTLAAVQAFVGPFSYAVGHSYGGASLVHALGQQLLVDRVAVLAPPMHYGHFARKFAAKAGLPTSGVAQWLDLLSSITGTHPDEISFERQVAELSQPALLLHGTKDQIIPFSQSEAVASIWPSVAWTPLADVGHFDLIADPKAIEYVIGFGLGKPF
ncbi:alpha/beta fold hydrolase [Paraburkholderia bannensis]|uniref:alpha/beta fold hydrolase n=1 Tax=Paraburkholderia bannensis TaxID=765414 RepID=UPI002AB24C0C|nr:alpha/beta fold hydrolase [Paraburkholderia bannensis]